MKKTPQNPNKEERRKGPGRRADEVSSPNFRDLADNAVQGVLVHANFRPLYCNAAFAKLFGYESPEEIASMPLIKPLIPEDMWAKAEEDYGDLIRGERKPSIFRSRGVRKDGGEIWLSVAERATEWHGVRAAHVCAFDITEQMSVEQTMLDSEQRLRSMLEILPVPVFISRWSDGRLLFVNRKTCLLFQQSAGPLLRGCAADFYVDIKDRENLRMLLQTVSDIREVEVRMKTAHGREFTAELAAIMMDYGGEPAVLVSVNDISQRKKLEAELFEQANTDELTGLSNRRCFLSLAEQEMRRALRFSRDLSVMMIDLDHFKLINDRYGHAVGDVVLQGVVKASLECLRQSDVMGRLGGEEFAVLLPETNLAAAVEVANRLLQHIASRRIYSTKTAINCTVSVGVAQLDKKDKTVDDLLVRADDAMYAAKNNGRNRVETA